MPIPETRLTLLEKIRDPDDKQAWEEFVRIYTPVVFSFSKSKGLNQADAEDMTQEVMKNVSRAIGDFEYRAGQAKFRSWLFQITRNRISTFYQKKKSKNRELEGTTIMELAQAQNASDEESRWDEDYRLQVFRWAASEIEKEFSPRIWKAFWQCAVEQRDPVEVGEELEMSRAAVYMAKSRCLKRLREKVEQTGEDWDLPPKS
ncbi:MAG: sigma-70 family RNA polymerase sigma factor [Verrucomicrobiota bacterium]